MNINALKAALDKRDAEIRLLRDTLRVCANMLTIEATSHRESGDPSRLRFVGSLMGQAELAHSVADGLVKP